MFPVPAGSGAGNTIVVWPDALVPARNDCAGVLLSKRLTCV